MRLDGVLSCYYVAVLVLKDVDARTLLQIGKVSRSLRMMIRQKGLLGASMLNTFPGIKDLPMGRGYLYYQKALEEYHGQTPLVGAL